jgi:hypothetical protein
MFPLIKTLLLVEGESSCYGSDGDGIVTKYTESLVGLTLQLIPKSGLLLLACGLWGAAYESLD